MIVNNGIEIHALKEKEKTARGKTNIPDIPWLSRYFLYLSRDSMMARVLFSSDMIWDSI